MRPTPITRILPKRLLVQVWKHLPVCKAVVYHISRERDTAIGFGERVKMRVHLLLCRWCAEYLRQLTMLERMIHSEAERSPEALPPGLLDRIKASLREDQHRSE